MDETVANNAQPKPMVRCDECDTLVEHYVTFVMPSNELHHTCWNCQNREDKFYNTKPGWHRSARQKQIEQVTDQTETKQ